MIRFFFFLTALGMLAACTQYREPQANCFAFLAATTPGKLDCQFTPLGAPEGDSDV